MMTTCRDHSDDKVGITAIFDFRYYSWYSEHQDYDCNTLALTTISWKRISFVLPCFKHASSGDRQCITLSECPMQAYITGWLDAGLQYPQCVHCDAAVLHLAIDIIVHGQWPGAWLATGQCLYLWLPYIFPFKLAICVTLKWQYVWPMSVTCRHISGGLDAGLQYLRCVSDSDAAVLHPAVDIVSIFGVYFYDDIMYRHEIIQYVSLKWQYVRVSYANLYISWWLCVGMHQQQGCRGLALGHRYRAWAMAWCLTGTRPLSISKMTLCIPMKLAIYIAWKYQYVWHMSVICKILYLVGLLWDCRISSALAGRCCSLSSSYWCACESIPCRHWFREWMHICWLKYRCLNQRWLFLVFFVNYTW